MDGRLYYSCYFGNKNPPGVTAAIDPASGKVLWKNTHYAVHGGCTISASERPALSGRIQRCRRQDEPHLVPRRQGRFASLEKRSRRLGDPRRHDRRREPLHAPPISTRHDARPLKRPQDRATSRKATTARASAMCGKYLLGSNMDVIDTADGNRLVSSGPAVDVILCTGAHVSNGRLYFTANGGGLQLSMAYGEEAKTAPPAVAHQVTHRFNSPRRHGDTERN